MAGLVGRRGRSKGMKRPGQGRNKGKRQATAVLGKETERDACYVSEHSSSNAPSASVTEGCVRQEEGECALSDRLSCALRLVWDRLVALSPVQSGPCLLLASSPSSCCPWSLLPSF